MVGDAAASLVLGMWGAGRTHAERHGDWEPLPFGSHSMELCERKGSRDERQLLVLGAVQCIGEVSGEQMKRACGVLAGQVPYPSYGQEMNVGQAAPRDLWDWLTPAKGVE